MSKKSNISVAGIIAYLNAKEPEGFR